MAGGWGILLATPATPEPGFWKNFFDIKLSDVVDTAGVVVAVFVYLYQRSKDRTDAEKQRTTAERQARQQWIWLLLLEPNRDYVLGFFRQLEGALAAVNHARVRQDERIQVSQDVERLLSEFERRFLSYFGGIDPKLAAENEDLFDELRTDLTQGLGNFNDADFYQEHKKLQARVFKARADLLNKLYSFSFAAA